MRNKLIENGEDSVFVSSNLDNICRALVHHTLDSEAWGAGSPDEGEDGVQRAAKVFWQLVSKGVVLPTFDALLKLAVECPSYLLQSVGQYATVILDEAHDISDAGILFFSHLALRENMYSRI